MFAQDEEAGTHGSEGEVKATKAAREAASDDAGDEEPSESAEGADGGEAEEEEEEKPNIEVKPFSVDQCAGRSEFQKHSCPSMSAPEIFAS